MSLLMANVFCIMGTRGRLFTRNSDNATERVVNVCTARLTRTALHLNLLNLETSKTIHIVVVAVVVNVCSAHLTRAAQDYIKPETARLTKTAQTSNLTFRLFSTPHEDGSSGNNQTKVIRQLSTGARQGTIQRAGVAVEIGR